MFGHLKKILTTWFKFLHSQSGCLGTLLSVEHITPPPPPPTADRQVRSLWNLRVEFAFIVFHPSFSNRAFIFLKGNKNKLAQSTTNPPEEDIFRTRVNVRFRKDSV